VLVKEKGRLEPWQGTFMEPAIESATLLDRYVAPSLSKKSETTLR
jgi:hypothetical protein